MPVFFLHSICLRTKRPERSWIKMKTTSLKTIYLTVDELKQALVEYLAKDHEELAQHLYDNECEMVWGQDGKEFLVSIDGEIEE